MPYITIEVWTDSSNADKSMEEHRLNGEKVEKIQVDTCNLYDCTAGTDDLKYSKSGGLLYVILSKG